MRVPRSVRTVVVGALTVVTLSLRLVAQSGEDVLFDGGALTGWTNVTTEPHNGDVANGVWRLDSAHGWWLTKAAYRDFLLQVRFRPIRGDSARANLLLRCYDRDRHPWGGYAIQLDLSSGKRPHGKLLMLTPPLEARDTFPLDKRGLSKLGERSPDDWHTLDIHAVDDVITASIDGEPLVAARGALMREGRIGLQVQKGALELRRISMHPESDSITKGGVRRGDEPGVTPPTLIRMVKPQYTRDAMDAKVQGEVWVEAVVSADGSVTTTRILKSLDGGRYGLDQQALQAARGWRFAPGRFDDKPVAVAVTIELTFTLK